MNYIITSCIINISFITKTMKFGTIEVIYMKISFEKNDLRLTVKQTRGFQAFPVMFHTHMEVLCVIKGEIKVNIGGETKILKQGDLCVIFPYVFHSYESSPDLEFRLIMFSPEVVFGFEKIVFSKRPVSPFLKMNDTFDFLTKKIVSFSKVDEKTALAYLSAFVGELMSFGDVVYTENITDTIAQRLLVYCNEHFTEDITVSSAATACFISESYVSKVFAKKFECSFRTYINQLRVNEARELLEKSNYKISEIMYACGFKNQSSFNRIFMNVCGKSPKEYRKNRL